MKNTYLNEILKVTKASVEEKKKRFPLIETSTSSENFLSKESFIKSLISPWLGEAFFISAITATL